MAWRDVVFLSWPMEPASLEGLLPATLELDTHDGQAWITLVAFRMRLERAAGLRRAGHAMMQANLRTYVRRNGRAGLRFLAVDVPSPGRNALLRAMGLPSRVGRVGLAGAVAVAPRGKAALRATVEVDSRPVAGPLEAFLADRDVAYLGRFGWPRLEVRHEPWPLHAARVGECRTGYLAGFVGDRPPAHAMASPGVDAASWVH